MQVRWLIVWLLLYRVWYFVLFQRWLWVIQEYATMDTRVLMLWLSMQWFINFSWDTNNTSITLLKNTIFSTVLGMIVLIVTILITAAYLTQSRYSILVIGWVCGFIAILYSSQRKHILAGFVIWVIILVVPRSTICESWPIHAVQSLSFGRSIVQIWNCQYITYANIQVWGIYTAQVEVDEFWSRRISWSTPQRDTFWGWRWGRHEFSRDAYWTMKWIAWQATLRDISMVWYDLNCIQSLKNAWYRWWSSRANGLAVGVLRWDRTYFDQSDYQTMIDSALVHLIAVSGSNVAILTLLVLRLCAWMPLYVRYGVVAIVLIWYLLICWFDSSVVRAVIMGLYAVVALMLWRKTFAWYGLGVTWIIMALRNPLWIIDDWGLRLSYAGVVWVMLMSSIRAHRSIKWLIVTSGVTLFMRPVLRRLTGIINITTLLTGIATSWIWTILMIGWALHIIWWDMRLIQMMRNGISGGLLYLGQWVVAHQHIIYLPYPWSWILLVVIMMSMGLYFDDTKKYYSM